MGQKLTKRGTPFLIRQLPGLPLSMHARPAGQTALQAYQHLRITEARSSGNLHL